MEQATQCAICHLESPTVQRGALGCGHTFHLHCICGVQTPLRCRICNQKYDRILPLLLPWTSNLVNGPEKIGNEEFLVEWVNEFVEASPGATLFTDDLHSFLEQFIRRNGVPLVKKTRVKFGLGKVLRTMFNIGAASNNGSGTPGSQRYRYRGIQLNQRGVAEFARVLSPALYFGYYY